MFITYLAFHVREIQPADVVQIMLTLALVAITGVYAFSTVRMVEEIKEQRVMASRPVIIQKAVREKDIYEGSSSNDFSHFEIYNAGNGPAIEVEIALQMGIEKGSVASMRQTFLITGQSAKFYPSINLLHAKGNLVCDYKSIYSGVREPKWYRTCLPLELDRSITKGKIYVRPNELEFGEATEKEHIDIFSGSELK